MIFKTFNNDIDKISAKWGIFGKSFNDIGTAISGKISDINKNFQATDDLIGSIKNSGDGIWARLYPTKEQIASLQINVPEIIDTKKANEYLNIMNQIDAGIHPVLSSYQEWHDELADGEKWIARYAQSTKGQIRSLEGVNEANQQARASALAHNEALKQQTLGAKAATVAMKALSVVGNMLAMYAITKLITAYSDYKEKLHDIAEEMSAQAKKSSDYVDNLLDLKTQLEEGTKSSDELTSAFKDQLEAMGYTETEIDNLIAKYNGLSGAIDEATRKALENAKTDAYADVASASKALEIDSAGGLFTDILIGDYKTGLEQLDSEIEKILSDVATKTAQQGNAWISKDNSAEGLYAYYNALKDVSRLIQETASETNNNELLDLGNAFDPTVYGEVTEAINKLKDSAELYGEAISRLHNADAQLELSDYLKTNDINSQETFDNYINGIKDSTEYSESYKQVLIDVANKAFPQFSQQAKNAAETLGNFGNEADIQSTITSSISQIATQLEPQFAKLGEAYKAIFTDDGFTLDDVDNSMLEGLRKSFAEIEEEVGVTFDATQLNAFFDTLTSGDSTADQVQQSFNDLATAYFYSTDTLNHLNEETAESIQKQLEEMGVLNAQEVVLENLKNAKVQQKIASIEFSEATADEIRGLISYGEQLGLTSQQVYALYLKQLLLNNDPIQTQNSILQLIGLCNAGSKTANILIDLYDIMVAISQGQQKLANGELIGAQAEVTKMEIEKLQQQMTNKINGMLSNTEVEWSNVGGGSDGASKAGGDAGEAFVEAFEEELADLQDLRDRGVIDEAEYLNRLRELYTRYFADRKEYLDEYNKYERQYLEGMKSLYDSALSGISKLLSNKIDAAQEGKEAAISALEEEKEAAAEAYQAQIDAIDEKISALEKEKKANQKIIDSLNDEIDAIREANEERDRQLTLQQKQIQLERMQNQRTILQYSEEKGMHYVQDTEGIRQAKNELSDAEDEIKIAEIEKQIKVYEDLNNQIDETIDNLNEQKDAIQEMLDASNEYYDKLIKQQEKMWDSMIKNLENQKSKWEELAEIQEIAEAYSTVESVFKDLGYSVEDVLNGNEAAFEDFKSKYISIMSDCGQNTAFQDGLAYASGVAKENFGSIIKDSSDVKNALTDIGSASTGLEPVATAIEKIGTSSSTASTSTSQVATNMGTLNTNTTGLSDNLDGINNSLNSVPDVSATVSGIAKSYEELGKSLSNGEDGTEIDTKLNDINTELTEIPADASTKIGSIATEYDKLDASIQNEDGTGLSDELVDINDALTNLPESSKFDAMATAFTNLGLAIKSVADALGVGEEGTVGGLVGALQSISEVSLGGSEDGEETGIIGQFNTLKEAVDSVTSSISGGTSGESSSGGDASNSKSSSMSAGATESGEGGLVSAIEKMGETATETLGEGSTEEGSEGEGDGVIAKFSQLKSAVDLVTQAIGTGEAEEGSGEESAINLIGALQAHYEKAEETLPEVKTLFEDLLVSIETCVSALNTMVSAMASMGELSIGGGVSLPAHAEGTVGKAFANGTGKYKGLPSSEKNALRSEYGQPELTVYPDGTTELTTEPTMSDLPKDTVIFNEEQTRRIMKNKGTVLGNAHANGTISLPNGTILQHANLGYDVDALVQSFKNNVDYIINPLSSIDKNVDTIMRNTNNISNHNTSNATTFSTGDIIVQGVQDVDGFAKAVKTHFPNVMLQKMHMK